LPLFWHFRVVRQCRNVCGTDFDLEGVEILAKMMQNGKKEQMFGTGLDLALALHFVQSQIYPGATFSTVPAKRYECPSMKKKKKKKRKKSNLYVIFSCFETNFINFYQQRKLTT